MATGIEHNNAMDGHELSFDNFSPGSIKINLRPSGNLQQWQQLRENFLERRASKNFSGQHTARDQSHYLPFEIHMISRFPSHHLTDLNSGVFRGAPLCHGPPLAGP